MAVWWQCPPPVTCHKHGSQAVIVREHSHWQISHCLPHGQANAVCALPVPGKQAGAACSPGSPLQVGAGRVEQNPTCAIQADWVSSWWIVVIWAIAYSSWVSQPKLKTSTFFSNEFVCMDTTQIRSNVRVRTTVIPQWRQVHVIQHPLPGLQLKWLFKHYCEKKPWLTLPTQTWQFLEFSSKICFVLAFSGHKETLPHPLHSSWG